MRMRLALGVALVALGLLSSPLDAAPPVELPPKSYVALGDSYAAGPLIPVQVEPWGCLKSSNNYAQLLARNTGVTVTDVTCSGADTDDMTEAQGVFPEANPPQFDALSADTDLVTLQIGGNDIGFGGIAETCVQAGVEGRSCKSSYVDEDGNDELRRRIAETAPELAAVLAGIRERSPEAEVFVLGYPGIFAFGPQASCPAMLVGEEDAHYLRGVHEALNAMIREQAVLAGTSYIDVYGPSEGKTACDLPVVRWVEPVVPVHAAAPIHPNLTGMLEMAGVIEAAMGHSLYRGPPSRV